MGLHFGFLSLIYHSELLYESDTMKSILYVAIFVACMFLISGVLKSRNASLAIKQDFEEFLTCLKTHNFETFHNKYPTFIRYRGSGTGTILERLETIKQEQQTLFVEAEWQFHFTQIADTLIEKIQKQPFQYEQRSVATITGWFVYKDGAQKHFRAVFQQNNMYSFSIDEVCVLNDRCVQ